MLKTFQIYTPPVHVSIIEQQTQRISPVRFSFIRRIAKSTLVGPLACPVACEIHPNKLHNEKWFKDRNFRLDTFINLRGHGAVMRIRFRLSVSLSLPSPLFLCPVQLAKGPEMYSHITSVQYKHCGAASKTVFNTELCNVEGAHHSIKSGHSQTILSVGLDDSYL